MVTRAVELNTVQSICRTEYECYKKAELSLSAPRRHVWEWGEGGGSYIAAQTVNIDAASMCGQHYTPTALPTGKDAGTYGTGR
jgi:hypothetical protein